MQRPEEQRSNKNADGRSDGTNDHRLHESAEHKFFAQRTQGSRENAEFNRGEPLVKEVLDGSIELRRAPKDGCGPVNKGEHETKEDHECGTNKEVVPCKRGPECAAVLQLENRKENPERHAIKKQLRGDENDQRIFC